MTYISRKTRITVSRWSDECDADYILRAVRKRSDGRFKRHSSCDDLRAWVNDYCVKHEHLVDLMSDGEFSGRPPFRLYGRFIPVPILFKLTQSLQSSDAISSKDKLKKKDQETSRMSVLGKSASDKCTCMDSSEVLTKNENTTLEKNFSLSRIQWERNHLEKNLYESTSLLNRALRTLERIDNLVDLTKDESENARNEEIQLAFNEAQVVCECNTFVEANNSNIYDSLYSSRSHVKKIQNTTKCTELLRKISGLREKLKKIQECRQMIMKEIHMTQFRAAKCESSNQVTELFSFREQSHVKKLKKKLEKLISERGRLLSEMCDALNSLNNLKKSSRLSLPRQKSSRMNHVGDVLRCGLGESASCACGCDCSRTSSEFDKFNSDSHSGESFCNECANNFNQMNPCDTFSDLPRDVSSKTNSRKTYNSKNRSSVIICKDTESMSSPYYCQEPKKNPSQYHPKSDEPCGSHFQDVKLKQTISKEQKSIKIKKSQNAQPEISNETKKVKRESKVNFADENESFCRKKYYQDDLTAFEKSLTAQQQAVIQKALKKIESRRSQLFKTEKIQKRPTSSPTTTREKNSTSVERRFNDGCERRVRSETTMQEIEKTLRNYEQRLKNYDNLEYKLEEIRQKISEATRMKREWAKQREEGEKQMEAEKEKSSKEITKLSSENRALKKQLQHLIAKFETQCKKIQSLKITAQKNLELECETEELKKELLKYQDTFEHQRKCITKWESVVVLQRTEIENLMNHIRRLTAENNYSAEQSSEKKNVQRSRSYSPEIIKPEKLINRAKTHGKVCRSSSEEENEPCYCNEYKQMENTKRNQEAVVNNESFKMEGKDTNTAKIEEKYQAQIAELKSRFVAEKEELKNLFVEKLKEVENYHKKMLQDLVIKSSSDLDEIQANHEEKLNLLTELHNRELESLHSKLEALQADRDELRTMLMAVSEGQTLPKEKLLNFLSNDSAKALHQ